MKCFFSKAVTRTVCVVLAMAIMSTGALATPGKPKEKNKDKPQENKHFSETVGRSSGRSGGGNSAIGEKAISDAVALIEEKIAALDDSDTKDSLNKLLMAYKKALVAEKEALDDADTESTTHESLQKVTAAARNALASALIEEGIEIIPAKEKDKNAVKPPKKEELPNGYVSYVGTLLDADDLEDLIADLDSKDTRDDLTKLLNAFTAAVKAEKAAYEDSTTTQDKKAALRKATKAACDALISALEDAGIDKSEYMKQDDKNPVKPPVKEKLPNGYVGYLGTLLDTDDLEDLIADLDSKDTRDDLTKLLNAFTAAVKAEKAAYEDSNTTQDKKVALRKATKAACDALISALEDAGIDKSEYMKQDDKKDDKPASDSVSSEKSKTTGSAVKSFVKWISSCFN